VNPSVVEGVADGVAVVPVAVAEGAVAEGGLEEDEVGVAVGPAVSTGLLHDRIASKTNAITTKMRVI
jgi:hypothetical protein